MDRISVGAVNVMLNNKIMSDSFWVAGFVFFANVFLFGAAQWLGIGRPVINFDYVVVVLLALFLPYYIVLPVLFAVFFFDVVTLVGQIFPFLRFGDVLYLTKFIGKAPAYYQAAFCVGVVSFFAMAFLLWKIKKKSVREGGLVVINVLVAAYLITIFIGDSEKSKDKYWRVGGDKLLSSMIIYNINNRSTGFVKNFQQSGEPLGEAVYSGVADAWFQGQDLGDKMLLVVNESWGVSAPEVQQAVLSPFVDHKDRYGSVEWGGLPFKGATVAGELRELCNLWPNHFNLKGVERGFEKCFPNRLVKEGYSTMAMHGAVGIMYDRVYWYPRAGFQSSLFFESKPWGTRCYSFPGVCDSELMGEVGKYFQKNDKAFVYWLTLNTHAIYDSRDIEVDVFDCGSFNIPHDTQTCRNLKLQAQFFHNLAALMDDPSMEGVSVIVVGDHEPPIMNKDEKELYYADDMVSWLKVSG